MEKENDMNEVAYTIEVGREVLDGFRSGQLKQLAFNITDENQSQILENIEGHLILCTEEMPTTYHGCYYYNGGKFPYVIKSDLQYLVLADGNDTCLVRITDTETVAGTRFRFQDDGKPSVEDPNGDSCIWEVCFTVELEQMPKTYLLRWNPGISSFTEGDYEECLAHAEEGKFPLNWSIYEWEEAKAGDRFYMMRVGDGKAGIVFRGHFVSDPYTADDWAGSTRQRHYVDLVCMDAVAPGAVPPLSLEKLQVAIPSIDWAKGHSGVLLPDEVAAELDELWRV
ncbi:MAG: hypothetical protein IJK87_11290 [Prevotella sp.]|nr:hypothetical protein [Prevotella sp.]